MMKLVAKITIVGVVGATISWLVRMLVRASKPDPIYSGHNAEVRARIRELMDKEKKES